MNIEYWLESISFADEEWKFAIPMILMVLDFLTGVTHAWGTGHLKSYRMREGLMRKFAEVSVLAMGALFEYGFNLPAYVLSGFSFYIMFMELVSICENLKKMGIPIPSFIEKAFSSVDRLQHGELTEEEMKLLAEYLKRNDAK